MSSAASRVAWTIARALAGRDRRWSLVSADASRSWVFHVGRARWTADLHVSFFVNDPSHEPAVVCGITFSGRSAKATLKRSAAFRSLCARLGPEYRRDSISERLGPHVRLVRLLRGARPAREILAELDRVARAFGDEGAPLRTTSRARASGPRLWAMIDAVRAHPKWIAGSASLHLGRAGGPLASINAIPAGRDGRRLIHALLFVPHQTPQREAAERRARARGYTSLGDERELALSRTLPLSLSHATKEAAFLATVVERV